ncbi:MAG: TonB-dependent receptor [Xanthomonadales bacterium]|jgi:outer membrane receptor for ferrienterochelin and colicin|nr:TonB-dependent receptor [Xanthomonadales bacterium]
MPRHPQVKALAMGVLLALGAVQFAHAQSSTSTNVTGRVVDSEGRPVAGAIVQILHVPSGTMKTELTDDQGRYSSRGLRVGGPFEVTVEADGYGAERRGDLSFRLGQTETVNIVMVNAQQLETVEVVATRTATVFDPLNMGAATTVSREQIDALPTINRSLEDFVRLDPRIVQIDKGRGGISAGGQNNRYNAINIDGVPTNDEFGLNDNGFPALNQPISLDALEEIAIGVSDYDVSQSDFTGASINAVTKSGTNEFKGSVYSYYRKDDWVGKDELNRKFTGFQDETTYGLTLGGPIIKDRLFFFISYEDFSRESPAPAVNQRIVNGVQQTIFSDAIIQQVRTAAAARGMAATGFAIDGISNDDEKIIAKVDWNISDQHRASLRYGRTEGSILRTPGIGATTLSFSDYWYTDNLTNESWTGQLYSDWTDVFSTEVSVAYSEYNSVPLLRTIAPSVQVRVGSDSIFLGTERSRQANRLETESLTGFVSGNLFLGDHEVKFGLDYKKIDIFNLFLQDAFGTYEFASIADFQNNARPSAFRSQFPAVAGQPLDSVAADWDIANVGLFLQDTWAFNANLTLNYGVRVDYVDLGSQPALNPNFAAAPLPPAAPNLGSPRGGFGVPNNTTIDGAKIVQPRVGFNYTFDADRPTQLRGGIGLFAGSSPNVWLSNSYSNTGILASGFNLTGTAVPADLRFVRDVTQQPRPAGTPPTPNVDLIDPNFKQPTVWKGTLAIEHELPWYGLVASAELLRTETEDNLFYQHLNLGNPVGRLPDGRLHYWGNVNQSAFANPFNPTVANGSRRPNRNRSFGDVMLLTNTGKGTTTNLTLALEKPFDDNWYAKLGYTYGRGRDVNPGTSSVSFSNWSSRIIGENPNDEFSAVSNYVFRDRITLALQYRHFFFDELPTSFGMFFEGRSGRPFSYVFQGDANGDNANQSNDLFFVPRGPGDVLFQAILPGQNSQFPNGLSAAEQEQRFWAYIENNSYLNSRRGQIVERNARISPWVSQADLRISQKLPKLWRVQGELFLDIINVGNLLKDSWGQIDQGPFPLSVQVARFAGVNADGRMVYVFPGEPVGFTRQDDRGESRWQAQIGLRFEF